MTNPTSAQVEAAAEAPVCENCKGTGFEPDVGDDMTPEVPCQECDYDEAYSRFYEMKP